MKKTIQIQYFAHLREIAGKKMEKLETEANTPEEVYAVLKTQYNKLPEKKTLFAVAVNDEFSPWTTLLKENDSVAFMTPIAGG